MVATFSCVGRFENTYFLKPTEANKLKVFGKDFMGWAQGMEEDDSVWQDAAEVIPTPSKMRDTPLRETLKTPSKTNIQSFAMGGLDHSFLVNDYGLDVLSNRTNGLEGTGITIRFQDGGKPPSSVGSNVFKTPKKGMLIKGESNMMLISPAKDGKSTAGGVSQFDIGTGQMVAEWKFEKDGTPITMRDVTNDSKGAQMYSGGATFLGLDDNRLCRWDMRDSQGIVQQLASPAALTWTEGHQVRGRNNSIVSCIIFIYRIPRKRVCECRSLMLRRGGRWSNSSTVSFLCDGILSHRVVQYGDPEFLK